jgi:hypothetical protein
MRVHLRLAYNYAKCHTLQELVRLRVDNARLLAEADHATADTVAALEQQLDDADRLSTAYASTLSDTRKELADVSTELAQALAKGLQLEVLTTY